METKTPRSLLKVTRDFLEERGSATPRVDAEVLLAHALGVERIQLYTMHDRPLDDDETAAFRELVRRRATGEPVAHLVGSRGFWSLDLEVSPAVLIPRPETELLVEEALRFARGRRDAQWAIADIGTGSGAIALALAEELPNARVAAIDASAEALDVARRNAARCALDDRVRMIEGNLLEPLLRRDKKAHLIVSNPPYVGERERNSLERDVRDFEPSVALFAGEDGLDLIRRLLPQAARALHPGGLFLMEFGAAQGDAVRELAQRSFSEARIARDLSGHDRVLVAHAPGPLALPLDGDAGAEAQHDTTEAEGEEEDGAEAERATPSAGSRRSGGLLDPNAGDASEGDAEPLAEVDIHSL